MTQQWIRLNNGDHLAASKVSRWSWDKERRGHFLSDADGRHLGFTYDGPEEEYEIMQAQPGWEVVYYWGDDTGLHAHPILWWRSGPNGLEAVLMDVGADGLSGESISSDLGDGCRFIRSPDGMLWVSVHGSVQPVSRDPNEAIAWWNKRKPQAAA